MSMPPWAISSSVPIPASKQINIQALEYTHAVGTYGPTIVSLKLDAFVL